MTIAIMADDLTGANDSGLQMATRGAAARVFLGTPSPGELAGLDVAILDTETRPLCPQAAEAKAEAVASELRAAGIDHVFKKVDSTLRGPVAAELAGAARGLGANLILVAPAFPAQGRTVENGRLLVNGVPVADTAFARDPATPVRESNVTALVAAGRPAASCLTVGSEDTRDPDALERRVLEALHRQAPLCVVFDSREEKDLNRIAAFGQRLEAQAQATGQILWVGSAGLAASLASAWGLTGAPEIPHLAQGHRPPLLVIGSVHPASRDQIDHLARHLSADPVLLDPAQILTAGAARETEIARCVAALHARIAQRDPALVLTTEVDPAGAAFLSAQADVPGWSRVRVGREIAASLGAVAASTVEDGTVDRLVLTGGETARAVMDAAAIGSLDLIAAIEPGIPLVRTATGPACHIVTKAGGFGTAASLAQAMDFLINGRLDP
ncbi:four-carbon acid sugar kinase family protein [Roseospira marina]|uniref:Four-carbon acid sugar kinase family protein n=1 Tax=Roseospira marina TaxID=140057 RepID=A0A5M6I7F8_9PROT|nr:four-carbon acid sugar kinase family protein [Roseospira marina]KAA5604194.1 four-carbon acid sugar kinase family protein [Roseospira marina]MBB4315709.1 uncharacterized protein YgbK (DUF1537 family) [Roseospira marina]MBB5088821.1 uncharacterized protein YgbK (DUF1537 family) [Roseospira marina]